MTTPDNLTEGVRQHQLVYAALKGKMGGELHALALETSVPAAGS